MENKSILHVLNIYFTIPYFLGDQLIHFHEQGYQEHIICSPSTKLKNYSITHKFKFKEILIDRKISLKNDFFAIKEIRKYIRNNKIDIVVGHTPKGALLGMIAAWMERIPIRIYFRHGLMFETSRGIKRKILIMIERLTSSLSTKVVNVSPSVSKRSIDERLNDPKKQVILSKGTCNGINTENFKQSKIDLTSMRDLRQNLEIPENSFVIGYVGRLVKDKGIIELINSFKILRKSYSNINLLLVGMLEERDALPMDIIEEIKTNPNIIHTGYIGYENIEIYYSLMDIFVLLSYREGFPTSILEASSMGLPIITTKVTGCIDAIIENETGIFTDHKIENITKAVKFFIENKEQKISFGKNGRKFVEENFDPSIIWKEIEKLYNH